MKKTLFIAVGILLMPIGASAGNKHDIEVMTQNQYLGADLTPIVAAPDPAAFNEAVIAALQSIASNNLPERVNALAESIADRNPHLVGLQEVYSFSCTETGTIPDACFLFDAAFNNHLTATLAALSDHGADYYVAAQVQNLTLPGLPVFLDLDTIPDMLITVIDRDVILARGDVDAAPVSFGCARASVDGCNFSEASTVTVDTALGVPISIERGFVAVDAVVNGNHYRFVNTHLEVQFPAPDPLAPFFQAAQATELLLTLTFTTPPGTRLLVLGDINSSPDDPLFPHPVFGPFRNPYQQLSTGTLIDGTTVTVPYTDTWNLRPGKPPGFTCCQLAELSNPLSIHDERIDVIFALPAPARVKANVLDDEPDDKTASNLWPSDHSSVSGRLNY